MNIRFRAAARADIEGIYHYLEGQSEVGARKVVSDIYKAVSSIADFPLAAEETDDKKLRVKALARYPYKIFYDIGRRSIEIVHIRHDSRRPRKIQ